MVQRVRPDKKSRKLANTVTALDEMTLSPSSEPTSTKKRKAEADETDITVKPSKKKKKKVKTEGDSTDEAALARKQSKREAKIAKRLLRAQEKEAASKIEDMPIRTVPAQQDDTTRTHDGHEDTAQSTKPLKSKKTKPHRPQPDSSTNPASTTEQHAGLEAEEDHAATSAKHRFILFIGNLPFSANETSIRRHFQALNPSSIRAPTDPKTGKFKGFAFVEFNGYDRMKSCIATYHHSKFDDGSGNPRKINVELTAGGGGNSKVRKEKIKTKNVKLEDERKRKFEEEKKKETE